MNIQRVVQEHVPSLSQATTPATSLPPPLSPIQDAININEAGPQDIDYAEPTTIPELPAFRAVSYPPEVTNIRKVAPPLQRLASLSPSLPPTQVIPPDPRPIYPGCPEIIYRQYLAEKCRE